MTTIVTRTAKGSPLTHVEVDTNFTNLNTNKLEAGAIALGSAGTPSISFTGDTNTGIFSPGADQLGITTAGVERVRVGLNGHVAIGNGSTITDFNFLNIQGSNVTHTVGVVLNKTDTTAQIWGMRNTGPLTFYNYTANTAALTITTGGLVGLGTSTPLEARLCVNGGISVEGTYSAFKANIFTADNTAGNTRLNSFGPNSSTAGSFTFIGYSSNASSGGERLTIDSSGRVGIGITGPTRSLEVAVGATSNNGILVTGSNSPGILISETSGSVNLNLVNDASGAYIGTSSNHYLVLRTNNTERARIDTSGRLLVGTTTAYVDGFNNAFTSSQLSKGSNNGRCFSDTRVVAAVNNSTVDVWVGRNAAGNPYNSAIAGHFYVTVGGGDAFTGVYSIVTCGLGTSSATLAAVSTVTRGTSPVSSVQIAADGANGAIKLTITYINNAGVVNGLESTISFVGIVGP